MKKRNKVIASLVMTCSSLAMFTVAGMSVKANTVTDIKDLESSSVFSYYNPYGSSDTAVYLGKYVTLDDIKDNYYTFKANGSKYYNPLTGKEGVKVECPNSYPITRFKVDSPLCAFIPKDVFTTPGDNLFIGDEYGYFVKTREESESYNPQTGSAQFYRNEVLLFDIDYLNTTSSIETSIEVVASCETFTFKPESDRLGFGCYADDTFETHNQYNSFEFSGLKSDLKYDYYYTVPAINLGKYGDSNKNPRMNNPREVFIGDISYGLNVNSASTLGDSPFEITYENCFEINHKFADIAEKVIKESEANNPSVVDEAKFLLTVSCKLLCQNYVGVATSMLTYAAKGLYKAIRDIIEDIELNSYKVDIDDVETHTRTIKTNNFEKDGSKTKFGLVAENFCNLRYTDKANCDGKPDKASTLALTNCGDKMTIKATKSNNNVSSPAIKLFAIGGVIDMKGHGGWTYQSYSSHQDFMRTIGKTAVASNSRTLNSYYNSNTASSVKNGVISSTGAFMVKEDGSYKFSNNHLYNGQSNFWIHNAYPTSLSSSVIYTYTYDDYEKKVRIKKDIKAHYYMRVFSYC